MRVRWRKLYTHTHRGIERQRCVVCPVKRFAPAQQVVVVFNWEAANEDARHQLGGGRHVCGEGAEHLSALDGNLARGGDYQGLW